MKFYTFGDEKNPVLMLFPGTCCHWKSNFEKVIPLLMDSYRVVCVSYDGFDESETTTFISMNQEVEKIEAYIQEQYDGHILAAYGCSLGGSFVGLLISRKNIHMDYGILGSSDLDQATPFWANLETHILLPMMYPMIRSGKIPFQKNAYIKAFTKMMGGPRPYISKQSCFNQFYSDLVTPLPENIEVHATQIHIFYALKMGKKYRKRYLKHFAHPILHEHDLQHEELLACYPGQWVNLVKSITN